VGKVAGRNSKSDCCDGEVSEKIITNNMEKKNAEKKSIT
jgi:hypothetical protein